MAALPPWLQTLAGRVRLSIVVRPRASKTSLAGVHDGKLKIHLAAPPVDGEANEALIRFLADTLDVRRTAISLVQGAQSRNKVVDVEGVETAVCIARLQPADT